MGMRKVLATWYNFIVFALKSSAYSEVYLLPLREGGSCLFAQNFMGSGLLGCICLEESSFEN